MSRYETMSFRLETERLVLRPWAESDAAEFRALFTERRNGTPLSNGSPRTAAGTLVS